jgi:glycosyltransferase involved in cell wall biosynthesis
MTSTPVVVLETRVVRGSGGGPDKTILNTPRLLEPAGYKTLCAYMHPPGDPGFEQLRLKAEAWGAPLLSVPDRGPWDWRVIMELVRHCRREKVAIWHGHDYKSNALGLIVRRFWPMRLVTTLHGWVHHTTRTPLYYAIDRLTLRHYERVLCVSADLYDAAVASGVPEDRCVLLQNGIRADEYRRTRSVLAAKESFGVPGDRLVVGAMGRLSAEKGFDALISVAHRLLGAGIDLELWIIGEGADRGRLEGLIKHAGFTDQIKLLGFRQDVVSLYEAMDAFALSSLREGLPNVVLEAMAVGVPVVATRISGVPALIESGKNGILVPPGDSDSLFHALGHVLTDSGLRASLAHEGRATIERNYTFERRIDRLRGIYDHLLARDHVLPNNGVCAPC